MCWGPNSDHFHLIWDGHQPNSVGLYTHYKDSLLQVKMTIPIKKRVDRPWHIWASSNGIHLVNLIGCWERQVFPE